MTIPKIIVYRNNAIRELMLESILVNWWPSTVGSAQKCPRQNKNISHLRKRISLYKSSPRHRPKSKAKLVKVLRS